MQEQLVAQLTVTSTVVLHINYQCLDAYLVHLSKHVIEERCKGVILRIGTFVELQVADALVCEKLIVIVRGVRTHDVLSVDSASLSHLLICALRLLHLFDAFHRRDVRVLVVQRT